MNQLLWTKIRPVVLHLAFLFAGGAYVAAQGTAGELLIGSRPTCGDLTAANIKLLNPDSSRLQRPGPPTSLEAEPVTLILKTPGSLSKPFHFEKLQARFRIEDFNASGRYYPPAHPVDARTPLSSLFLSTTVGEKELADAVKDLGSILNVKLDKLNAWIDNRLWEETKGIVLVGDTPNTTAQLGLSKDSGEDQKFMITVSLVWKEHGQPQKSTPGDGEKATK